MHRDRDMMRSYLAQRQIDYSYDREKRRMASLSLPSECHHERLIGDHFVETDYSKQHRGNNND